MIGWITLGKSLGGLHVTRCHDSSRKVVWTNFIETSDRIPESSFEIFVMACNAYSAKRSEPHNGWQLVKINLKIEQPRSTYLQLSVVCQQRQDPPLRSKDIHSCTSNLRQIQKWATCTWIWKVWSSQISRNINNKTVYFEFHVDTHLTKAVHGKLFFFCRKVGKEMLCKQCLGTMLCVTNGTNIIFVDCNFKIDNGLFHPFFFF